MKNFLKLLRKSTTVAFLAVFVIYFYNNKQVFSGLLDTPWAYLLVVGALKLVKIYNSGQFMKAVLMAYNKNIPNREGFYVSLLSSIGNFFGPYMGGAGVRAIYLKRKYKLSYTNFAATISGFYFITFIVYSLIGLLSLVMIHLQQGVWSAAMYVTFAAWLLSTAILAEVRSVGRITDWFEERVRFLHRVLKRVNGIIKGWRIIKDDKKLFFKLNRLTVYGFLISFLTVWIEFVAIGVSPEIPSLALYVTLSSLALLVSITPSAIGIREAIFIFSGQLLGLTTEQILQLAVIDRGVNFIVMFVSYVYLKVYRRSDKILGQTAEES